MGTFGGPFVDAPPNVFEGNGGLLTGLKPGDFLPVQRTSAGAALGLDALKDGGQADGGTVANPVPLMSMPISSYSGQVARAESGGDPNATNPSSSASGAHGFTDGTWLETIRKNRPDLAGQSDEQLLTLKADPALSGQMADAYGNANAAILQKNGLPVTEGSKYLAHFAGPGGAVKVLQADPNAPVSDILGPAAVKANPFLKDMTAQGLQAWAAKKMGASVPEPGVQNNAPANSPSPPQAAPAAPPPSAPPIFPPQAAPQQAAQAPQVPDLQAAPIFYAQRKPIDLSALRNAFQAPVFPRQG